MEFSTKYINLIASPSGTSVNVRKEPTTASAVLFNRENKVTTPGNVASAGRTTGDFIKDGDYTWYKITFSKSYGGQTWGWVRNDVIKFFKPKADDISNEKAQSLIDNLVKTDMQVYESSLKITPLLDAAEKKGVNVEKYKNTFKGIIQRLDARQNKIKNSTLLKWKTGIKKGMEWLKDGFKSYLRSNFGIITGTDGIGSITAIVIGAVIGGGIAVAAYFAFKPDYDESQIDLKMTKELEKALSMLTPEEAKQLQKDLETQIDKGYNQGKTDERFNTIGSGVKWVLIIGAVAFVVSKGLSMVSKAKQK